MQFSVHREQYLQSLVAAVEAAVEGDPRADAAGLSRLTKVGLGVLLGVLLAAFSLHLRRPAKREEALGSPGAESSRWSTPAIAALTSYRFYTGYLSATWMPYLLAMEGQALMGERQSLFMGCAKLLYGMSVLLNPLFGLIGDRFGGRSAFLLAGIGATALGALGCLHAAHAQSVHAYFLCTALWMFGEALADVTTETLVPALLPREQYDISSAVKSVNFLLGGLAGYGALLVMREAGHRWLYASYLALMLLCGSLSMLSSAHGRERGAEARGEAPPLRSLVAEAYLSPLSIKGGFPRACACICIFSAGASPMFYLFLMVRDVIGLTDPVRQQSHFCVISLCFFLAAAVASAAGPVMAKLRGLLGLESTGDLQQYRVCRDGAAVTESFECASAVVALRSLNQPVTLAEPLGPGRAHRVRVREPEGWMSMHDLAEVSSEEAGSSRWTAIVLSQVAFAASLLVIPTIRLAATVETRVWLFYALGTFFGFAFGAVYTRFQECLWFMLPADVDLANALGFAAMAKLFGVGLGNFFVGAILDRYSSGKGVGITGYWIADATCAVFAFVSAAVTYTLPGLASAAADH